jgi:hypothetical protein
VLGLQWQEEKMLTKRNNCPNYNHGRSNAPVHFCPVCGEVVNEDIHIRKCNVEEHTRRRRERSKYCVDCGEKLMGSIALPQYTACKI